MQMESVRHLVGILNFSIFFRRILRLSIAIIMSSLIGCAALGPKEIQYGRIAYNTAIQRTTNDQLMMNIIRAKNSEHTLFFDVTEVNAAAQFQAQLTGAKTGIGARRGTSGGTLAGAVEQIGSMFQYQEQPNIRYQPLQGQPLVQQLVRPVDVDSIWFLSDSNWPLSSILSFTVNYISPNYKDHFAVLNAILQLDAWGALGMAAVKSKLTAPSTMSNDTLVLYLEPHHVEAKNEDELAQRRREILDLWIRLLRLYATVPQPSLKKTPIALKCDVATETRETLAAGNYLSNLQKRVASMDSEEVERHFQCLPKWIEIRTLPVKQDTEEIFMGPVMRTHSAMGILRTSVEEWAGSQIEFLPLKAYERIRNHQPKGAGFYILLYGERKHDLHFDNTAQSDQDRCTSARIEVEATIQMLSSSEIRDNNDSVMKSAENLCRADSLLDACGYALIDMCVTLKIKKDMLTDIVPYTYFGVDTPIDVNKITDMIIENRLAHLRRLILIIEDDSPPEQNGVNPFVSYDAVDDQDSHRKWYYIDNNDRISKDNFALLLDFFTIMAIPSQTPPLQPSISVGGVR